MEKGKNKKINATQRKVLESIWHPTFSAGIMNLKTLLPLLFCGLRHHLSEFHRSRTILQIVDNCLSLSLFLISINSRHNISNIIFLLNMLLSNFYVMSNVWI